MMLSREKQGVLLVNLGTPDAPTAEAVNPYLKEFLMDPFVLDENWLKRWILVNLLIVPKRAPESAKAYLNIWTERGSPLLFHTQDLTQKVAQKLTGTPVEFGMRYGKPSIASALQRLKAQGVTHVQMLPLYPQYSEAANRSSIDLARQCAEQLDLQLEATKDFYAHPAYVQAVSEVSRPYFVQAYDHVLFSYHGLPERQLTKLSSACRCDEQCCKNISAQNADCYRAQCYATTTLLVHALQIPEGKYSSSFQSRLGNTPWIRPYTDEKYLELARAGKKRVLVMCPSFVADCLETIEEIGMRGQEDFHKAGGEMLQLVPSLNSADVWVDAVLTILQMEKTHEKNHCAVQSVASVAEHHRVCC